MATSGPFNNDYLNAAYAKQMAEAMARARGIIRSDIVTNASNSVHTRVVLQRRPRPNPLNGLDKLFRKAARDTLDQCANEIDDMERHILENSGHVDTGALRDSIHHSQPSMRKGIVSVKGYADATNDGVMYEEFLEHGSGKYRDDGTGRKTPWTFFKKTGSQKVFDKKSTGQGMGNWMSDDTVAKENERLYFRYGPMKTISNRDRDATISWNNRKTFNQAYNGKWKSETIDEGSFITTEGIEPTHFVSKALEVMNPIVSERFRQNVVAQMSTSGRYSARMQAKAARSARAKKAAATRKANKAT